MPTLKKIKDPIHGYVHFSAIEERLLSHRLILRMHHVRQNGAAYLVYPSIRVHRFEHSLGAMHIAGQMFNHAIRFSTNKSTRMEIRNLVDQSGFDISKIVNTLDRNTGYNESGVTPRKADFIETDTLYMLYNLNQIDDETEFCMLLLFQAVRIAALIPTCDDADSFYGFPKR